MWSIVHDGGKTLLAYDGVLTLEVIDPAGSGYSKSDLALVTVAVLNNHPPVFGWGNVCPPR